MVRPDDAILADAMTLHAMWKRGALGGEVMPEDAHPALDPSSEALARYFTLGMALNYQRSSYSLWKACTTAFEDAETAWVFDPELVAETTEEALRAALLKHRVALQPARHPAIWRRNAEGLVRHAGGSVRMLLESRDWDISAVKGLLAAEKPSFPYLSGPKISNYWLYVLCSYMSWPLANRQALTVAPDTHVVAASRRLGLVAQAGLDGPLLVSRVADAWRRILDGSGYAPIDMHTPLWLWSRGGFIALAAS
ncbi:MAG TPA: hypothetical protein VE309_13415 [Caulobacteraceae bacterium]|jgi:hypothetical protein|nr:hypothetical protein [Caulobacteraceae bacterium]